VLLKEFRSFLLRGNVVDLAVAVVVGTAFTALVTALGRRPAHADHRGGLRQARLL
jgi:large-conductance mechanosensitive channel